VLLDIPEWNFDWQDEYRYTEPVPLPAGTRLDMRFDYDNSADNPRNPSAPPRRVRYGPRSTDEMAELLLQVVPRDPADAARLEADFERWRIRDAIDWRERMAELDPLDAAHPAAIGASWLALERHADAVAPLERALALDADHVTARNNLGFALLRLGRHERAASELRRAIALRPDHLEARFNLAEALRQAGDGSGALAEYRRILAADDRLTAPLDAAARLLVEQAEKRDDEAAAHEAIALAERGVELSGGVDPTLLETLALAYAAGGRDAEARATLDRHARLATPEATAALRTRIERARERATRSR
jgi:tetratricopeptide (TPR) repeat protein